MKDKLSIIHPDEITLETNQADRAAIFLKAVAGAAPVVGSLVTELITVTIPNQKQDRIVAFLKVLSDKVKYIEEDVLRQRMKNEGFTNLLEEAMRQASRSLSEERRNYIASLLKNSLTMDEVDQIGQKELLELLNELNDIEIIFLKCESLRKRERQEFRERHKQIFPPSSIGLDDQGRPQHRATQTEEDRRILLDHYTDGLLKLGVLKAVDQNIDDRGFDVSSLGYLLLYYIDLGPNEKNTNPI